MSKNSKEIINAAFDLLDQWAHMSLGNCNPVPLFEALRKYNPDKYAEVIRNALKAGGSAQQNHRRKEYERRSQCQPGRT